MPAISAPTLPHPPLTAAKPFVKWAGGKSQLLAQFAAHYPPALRLGEITRYVEPFLGSGAVFLDVAQRFPIRQAYLTDINPELVLVYQVVQRDTAGLIERLQAHADAYLAGNEAARHGYFYDVRAHYSAKRVEFDSYKCNYNYGEAWIDRAAAMIFLNKTCFNGLFRVNARGEFNVPCGRYTHPAICDAGNLQRVAALLQCAEIAVAPYAACAKWVDAQSFVYFDPPYRPLTRTSSFTAYSTHKFGEQEQRNLATFYRHLHETTGAKLMLSNSDPTNSDPDDDFFARCYDGFCRHRVFASRMINSQADKRGKITELLITNY